MESLSERIEIKANQRRNFAIFQLIIIVISAVLISCLVTNEFKLSIWIGFILTIILIVFIYSIREIRCIYLLFILQLFTRRGQKTFLIYTFYLTYCGPLQNINENLSICSKVFGCIRNAIIDILIQFKDYTKNVIENFEKFTQKLDLNYDVIAKEINDSFTIFDKLFHETSKTLRKASEWLDELDYICDPQETPYNRCLKSFESRISDCLKNKNNSFICDILEIKQVCAYLKIFEVACEEVKEIIEDPINTLNGKNIQN